MTSAETSSKPIKQHDSLHQRVLIEVVHPAHVLFFANPIRELRTLGHEVLVASRHKDVTTELLDAFEIEHHCLSTASSGLCGMAAELIKRDYSLLHLSRQFQPHIMCGFGGVSISHVGRALNIPAIGFYDTDHAVLQQRLTLPFIRQQYVPDQYDGPSWPKKLTRFHGIKAISYLHPNRFIADASKAKSAGLAGATANFMIRTVNWQSNHDIGRAGWSHKSTLKIVEHLSKRGKVHISSEGLLPSELQPFAYQGSVGDFHHLLAHCDLYVGESATVATEAFMLGVPSIYAVDDRRSYIDDLAEKGLLVKSIPSSTEELLDVLDDCLASTNQELIAKRDDWLREQVDLAQYVVERILHHCTDELPASMSSS